MGTMLKIHANGCATAGIELNEMAQAFMILARKDPKATLSMSDSFICLEKGYGDVWIVPSEGESIPRSKTDETDFFLIPPGQTLQLQHEDNNKSYTIDVLPSGYFLIRDGLQKSIDGPPQAKSDLIQKAYNWMYEGELGSSSLAIVDHLILNENNTRFYRQLNNLLVDRTQKSTPLDNSDWNRVAKLIMYIPQLEDIIQNMGEVSSKWSEIVEKDERGVSIWDEKIQEAKNRVLKEEHTQDNKSKKIISRIPKV